MNRLLFAAAAALTLTACASGAWTKPGADAAAVSRDLDACRGVALGRATPPAAPSGSSEAITDRRTGSLARSTGSNERFIEEHEEVSRCMQKRGYTLQRQH